MPATDIFPKQLEKCFLLLFSDLALDKHGQPSVDRGRKEKEEEEKRRRRKTVTNRNETGGG